MRRAAAIAMCALASSAWAAEAKLEKVRVGTDLPTLERGAEAVLGMCLGCHGLKYLKYRDLARLGIAREKVDVWRGARPLGATLASLMPAGAAQQSFGVVPPDLSLIAKARDGGPAYVYSLLLGYYVNPEGAGDNHVFPGTKMPDILGVSGVSDPVLRAPLQDKARDVASFLVWAADPRAEERHTLGYYVIGYLVVLTALLYWWKRRIWGRLK